MGSVMAVAQALFEGSSQVRTSRRTFAHFVGGLWPTAAGNLHRDADHTLQCARDLDHFFAVEAHPNLPATQSEPTAAPAPSALIPFLLQSPSLDSELVSGTRIVAG